MSLANAILNVVPKPVIRSAFRSNAKLKHHSPDILFGAGIAGVVVGNVLTARATLKAVPVVNELEFELTQAREFDNENDQTRAAHARNLTRAYSVHGGELVKLYAPAVAVTGASIFALTKSRSIMQSRQDALVAAYAGLQLMHDKYRGRVQDELGVEREADIFSAAAEKASVDSNGDPVIQKMGDPNAYSPYARFFDEASREWSKDPELNRLYVQCQQNYLNQRLQVVGHVFLNEAYDALGLERSSAGQVVGWLMNGDGDNFIDFGMYHPHNAPFVNGYERSVLLDFNVDGLIIDKI